MFFQNRIFRYGIKPYFCLIDLKKNPVLLGFNWNCNYNITGKWNHQYINAFLNFAPHHKRESRAVDNSSRFVILRF